MPTDVIELFSDPKDHAAVLLDETLRSCLRTGGPEEVSRYLGHAVATWMSLYDDPVRALLDLANAMTATHGQLPMLVARVDQGDWKSATTEMMEAWCQDMMSWRRDNPDQSKAWLLATAV